MSSRVQVRVTYRPPEISYGSVICIQSAVWSPLLCPVLRGHYQAADLFIRRIKGRRKNEKTPTSTYPTSVLSQLHYTLSLAARSVSLHTQSLLVLKILPVCRLSNPSFWTHYFA